MWPPGRDTHLDVLAQHQVSELVVRRGAVRQVHVQHSIHLARQQTGSKLGEVLTSVE